MLLYISKYFSWQDCAFSSCRSRLSFARKVTAFTLQGPAYECSGNFLLGFYPILPYSFRRLCFSGLQNNYFRSIIQIYKPDIGPREKIAKTGGDIRNAKFSRMNRRKLKNRGHGLLAFRKESVFLSCAKYRKHNFCQLRILLGNGVRSVYTVIWEYRKLPPKTLFIYPYRPLCEITTALFKT